jgi:hypothetical protein
VCSELARCAAWEEPAAQGDRLFVSFPIMFLFPSKLGDEDPLHQKGQTLAEHSESPRMAHDM